MKLLGECVICGEEKGVEMHHIKKVRKIKAKGYYFRR